MISLNIKVVNFIFLKINEFTLFESHLFNMEIFGLHDKK